jgi:hypothetical protein
MTEDTNPELLLLKAEILSVLRRFATDEDTEWDRDAARDLYLKLGGVL